MHRTPISYHQLRWLRKLARVGEAQRKGRTGYTCMQRGWTEWARIGTQPIDWNEKLTDAGRDMLRQYRNVPLRDLKGKRG